MAIRTVREFVAEVKNVLQLVVDHRALLFRQASRPLIENAWKALLARGVFDQLDRQLNPGGIDYIGDDKLSAAGLSGPEWTLKARGFNAAFDMFAIWGGKKWLKKLLEWINTILSSLVDVLPVGEPIKELKEALEQEMDDAEDGIPVSDVPDAPDVP